MIISNVIVIFSLKEFNLYFLYKDDFLVPVHIKILLGLYDINISTI